MRRMGLGRITRRDTLRIMAVGGVTGLAWSVGLRDGAESVSRTSVLMGTEVRLQVLADDREAAALAADETLQRMAQLEAQLSRYRNDSDVGRLNLYGQIDDASDALLSVLRLAREISDLGDGAFDVTVQPLLDLYRQRLEQTGSPPAAPEIEARAERVGHRALHIEGRRVAFGVPGMRLTLDGIGKGYVVDRGVDVLRRHGFDNVFVEAGGDLVAAGAKAGGAPWRIGIRRPRPGLALQARFDARGQAVATSGDYMQVFTPDYAHHHIIDPRTGVSSPELASATVTAPDAATADALATLVLVLGEKRGRALLEDLPGCEGYLVSKDLRVMRTSRFAVT